MESIYNYISRPISVTLDTRLSEIRHILKKYDINELVVLDSPDGHKPLGIIKAQNTEFEGEIEIGDKPYDESAKDLMVKVNAVVMPHASVEECLNIMRQHDIEIIPVVDSEGEFVGTINKNNIIHRILH